MTDGIDVKAQILTNERVSKNQTFQKVHEEGQQHFADKLEKDKDSEKTSVHEVDKSESENVDAEGKGAGGEAGGKKKKHDNKSMKEVKDPDKGNFIDIKT